MIKKKREKNVFITYTWFIEYNNWTSILFFNFFFWNSKKILVLRMIITIFGAVNRILHAPNEFPTSGRCRRMRKITDLANCQKHLLPHTKSE